MLDRDLDRDLNRDLLESGLGSGLGSGLERGEQQLTQISDAQIAYVVPSTNHNHHVHQLNDNVQRRTGHYSS